MQIHSLINLNVSIGSFPGNIWQPSMMLLLNGEHFVCLWTKAMLLDMHRLFTPLIQSGKQPLCPGYHCRHSCNIYIVDQGTGHSPPPFLPKKAPLMFFSLSLYLFLSLSLSLSLSFGCFFIDRTAGDMTGKRLREWIVTRSKGPQARTRTLGRCSKDKASVRGTSDRWAKRCPPPPMF